MKRKIVLIIFVFLLNIIWVNAISVTNKLVSHYNLTVKIDKKTDLNNNNIIDDLDVMLETNLSYNNEDASVIGKKIDNYLKDNMEGYGELIAKYSITNEVDPYLIASMIIESTKCDTKCSVLVSKCNNVYKAIYNKDNLNEASCFGGSYRKFGSIDESIKSFIKYVKTNFYENELTNANSFANQYKKDSRWVFQVNLYIEKIKKSSIS